VNSVHTCQIGDDSSNLIVYPPLNETGLERGSNRMAEGGRDFVVGIVLHKSATGWASLAMDGKAHTCVGCQHPIASHVVPARFRSVHVGVREFVTKVESRDWVSRSCETLNGG